VTEPKAIRLPVAELESLARAIRSRVIQNSHHTKTPHLASCLSAIDVLVAAYFHALRLSPEYPRHPERDRFILSKGHAAPALFRVLAERGFYPESLLEDYGKDGSLFAEHPPTPRHLPGIEAATGSLGHGLPMGLGMAVAGRLQGKSFNVFALVGDGECNEGSVWEAALLAAAQRLDRLCVIVDSNRWQATGRSQEIMEIEPLPEKWRAFGWSAVEVDGHDLAGLASLLSEIPDGSGRPVAIVARTIKGKGVSFMEDDNDWHYRIPSESEVSEADRQLGFAS
jgi:transketolase